MIKLTYQQVVDLKPCSVLKIPSFGTLRTMSAIQALDAGVSISDLLWVAAKLDRQDLCVQFALACAKRAVHLNTAPPVQRALDAAQAWLDNPNRGTANTAAAAFSAANAAAYTASAANAAANAAAYAAAYTANAASAYTAAAAASAANTAAYAANAAAYAAAAFSAASLLERGAAKERERVEQRRIFLSIFGT